MAAKDYKICCALFNAYIAKVSKRNPNLMLEDRRKITESEILGLIDWYLDNRLDENNDVVYFDSQEREGFEVHISYVKKINKEVMTREEIEDTVIAVERDSAYIAKIIKGNKAISEVRREITDDEICGLIDWFLDNRLEKDNDTIYFESRERKGYNVKLSFVKKEE